MDEYRRYYAKWNKLEKDKYHTISIICGICKWYVESVNDMWNLKKQMNKQTQTERLMDTENKWVVDRGGGVCEVREVGEKD